MGSNITYNNLENGFAGEGNISEDPQLNEDYTLKASSPCIDAGDPNSELDPDGTRADMGALYYNQYYVCMDTEACNYSDIAIYDDGSCVYDDNCYGCTNVEAVNYEEDAVYDDGSCIVPDIIVPDDYGTIQQAMDNADNNIFNLFYIS